MAFSLTSGLKEAPVKMGKPFLDQQKDGPLTGLPDPATVPTTGPLVTPPMVTTSPNPPATPTANYSTTPTNPSTAVASNQFSQLNTYFDPGTLLPGSANPTTPATPRSPTVAGVGMGPTLGSVSDDMLVEDRLNRLLKTGSPLMEQASARAKQSANARGMMNSSLAGQAGQEAVISSALPIAQQDAQTYGRVQSENLGYQNQFTLADKNMLGQGDLQGRDLENRMTISREGNATQLNAAQLNAAAVRGAAQMNAQVDRERIASAERSDAARIASAERLATMDLSSRAGEAELNRVWQSTQNSLSREANTALAQLQIDAQTRTQLAGLQQNTLTNFSQQMTAIFTSTMSAEDKTRYYNNLLATYTGSPYFPYQPTSGAYGTTTPAPAPAPAPSPGRDTAGGN